MTPDGRSAGNLGGDRSTRPGRYQELDFDFAVAAHGAFVKVR